MYCKFCGGYMQGENITNSQNSKKYQGFYNCTRCGAICDGRYEDSKNGRITIEEKWWNPKTKQYDEN